MWYLFIYFSDWTLMDTETKPIVFSLMFLAWFWESCCSLCSWAHFFFFLPCLTCLPLPQEGSALFSNQLHRHLKKSLLIRGAKATSLPLSFLQKEKKRPLKTKLRSSRLCPEIYGQAPGVCVYSLISNSSLGAIPDSPFMFNGSNWSQRWQPHLCNWTACLTLQCSMTSEVEAHIL